ncbi:hypothetical protein ANCDUO_24127 [Ancylostoma duodenale]|uniref:G-protein coupled receptors family 1 profile domain-containing protein n=1 Tax=Ancylostoma duodenale TaxID=51022 RepID=A0A0C2FLS2_9BILA|nr:hypothetical protein ANCDUO_24127 [Ancylostoma duodenale]
MFCNFQQYLIICTAVFDYFTHLARCKFSTSSHRANIFLACLAVCDVCFLILMIPHSMGNFDYFAFSLLFRYLYLRSKIHLVAFANWTSAVSIWWVISQSHCIRVNCITKRTRDFAHRINEQTQTHFYV